MDHRLVNYHLLSSISCPDSHPINTMKTIGDPKTFIEHLQKKYFMIGQIGQIKLTENIVGGNEESWDFIDEELQDSIDKI